MPQSSKIDWAEFKRLGELQLGKPYVFGAVAGADNFDPVAFDCSELVRWLYARVGVKVPDGSDFQYKASVPIKAPKLGDLGFFKAPDKPCHHVGIWWDSKQVLEARGHPWDKVIYRPVAKWEAWKEFTGWRRPVTVLQAERS